mmetsp:Transcript_13675/g.43182  ORF Transcript_13675/g.43182 Transcript_13675/m.43182 type:complete len:233 (-) Transcript_13675:375-1073(-)
MMVLVELGGGGGQVLLVEVMLLFGREVVLGEVGLGEVALGEVAVVGMRRDDELLVLDEVVLVEVVVLHHRVVLEVILLRLLPALTPVLLHRLAVLPSRLGLGLDVRFFRRVVRRLPDRPQHARDLRVVERRVGVLEGLALFVGEEQEGGGAALRGVRVLLGPSAAAAVRPASSRHGDGRRTVEALHLGRVPRLVLVRELLPLLLLRLGERVPLLAERAHHVLGRGARETQVD